MPVPARVGAHAYTLAVVHLLMTVCTKYPTGLIPVVSFRLHGAVELVVGVVLVIVGFLLFEATTRVFHRSMGGIILLTWLLTDYKAIEPA